MKLGSAIHQKMGNVIMRKKKGKSRGDQDCEGSETSQRQVDNVDEELELLKQSIIKNPHGFVLNNLMMCVPFFGNYEKEMEHIKEKLMSSREAELNQRLPTDKHVLLPDVLHEHVARNVVFKSKWQTLVPTIELLQSVRIFVVHDNIEITEHSNPPQYSSVNDTITYNMLLEKSKNEGYVKLRLLDKSHLKKSHPHLNVNLSTAPKKNGEFDSDDDSDYGRRSNTRVNLTSAGANGSLGRSVNYPYSRSVPDLSDEKSIYETRSTLSRDSVYGTHSTYNIKEELEYEENGTQQLKIQRSAVQEMDNSLKPGTYQRNPKRQQQTKIQGLANRSPASSVSSGYKSGTYVIDSDSDCGPSTTHSDVNSLKTRSGSDSVTKCLSSPEIPLHCFKKIIRMKDGKIYNPREEQRQFQNERQLRNWNAWMRYNYNVFYTSSLDFMRHFVDMFVNTIAVSLNFDEEAIEQVKVEGCVIYCDKRDCRSKYNKFEAYEIMPAVLSQWPEECAHEWFYRETRKSWPDEAVANKIQELGCYIVPEGFPSQVRVANYLQQDLEWQLTFPAAERYLETCLTHAQVHVYLMAVTLHKTFLQPIYDPNVGLTTSHIRNKLFWMIEQYDRPSQWSDNRTGESLLHLLKSIYQCINQYEPTMEDYFIKNKNLFQRIPREHLLHAQKQLKRIIDNPVMYVFHAMENLKYSRDFFPKPDYKRLLEILTLEDSLLLVNPCLNPTIFSPPLKAGNEQYPQRKKEINYSGVSKKDSEKSEFVKSVSSKALINTRKDTDCIIEIPIRCRPIDDIRLCVLLDFFISHFIKLARRCHQYNDFTQRTVYLNQAERLSILLSEYSRCADDAKAFLDEIKTIKEWKASSQISQEQDNPPETPKRNAEAPIFVRPLNERFVHESPEPKPILKHNKDLEENVANSSETSKRIVHASVHNPPREDEQQKPDLPEDKYSTFADAKTSKSTRTKFVTIAESCEESFLSDSTYI